jgi:hypothetical protein
MGTATQDSTSGSVPTHRSSGLVVYVVQVKTALTLMQSGTVHAAHGDEPELGNAEDFWQDIATVEVKPRTKKRTVIEKGLAEAGIEKTADLEARLLDEHAAYVWRAKPPEPAALRLT